MLNHNTETVPRLYRHVRPGARFERSLELLRRSSAAGLTTKSGIMVGLGETWDEILETIRAIRDSGTHVLTVGQYLRPSAEHLPVLRYYTPEEFAEIKRQRPVARLRPRRVRPARTLVLPRGRAGPRRSALAQPFDRQPDFDDRRRPEAREWCTAERRLIRPQDASRAAVHLSARAVGAALRTEAR